MSFPSRGQSPNEFDYTHDYVRFICFSHIGFITWNINGWGSPVKRKKVQSYLKHKQVDVAFVQENHITDNEALKFK